CRNRDHVTLGQVVNLTAFDTWSATLPLGRILDIDRLAARDEGGFAFDDDENMVGPFMYLDVASTSTLRQDDQAVVVDNRPSLGDGGRDLVVWHVSDNRGHTIGDR